jgi:hypothetical protein
MRSASNRKDPLKPPGAGVRPTDAGGYIGHEPELAQETIPGGVQPGDVRIAGVATQPAALGERTGTGQRAAEGHREASDPGEPREAGQNR